MDIPLTRGYVAVIDDDDAHLVVGFRWVALGVAPHIYAVSYSRVNGRKVATLMHRLLLGPSASEVCDHIDGNGLNNCRNNIRIASLGQNNMNSLMRRSNKCGVRNVFLDSNGRGEKQWRGQVIANGKRLRKWFRSKEAAEAWVTEMRRIEHGEFAIDMRPAGGDSLNPRRGSHLTS